MRDHWKPSGGFPPLFFLLETGVSSLCPVPCSETFYQEEQQLGRELAAVRATSSVKKTWEQVPGLLRAPLASAWYLNPGAPLRPWRSVSCLPLKNSVVACSLHPLRALAASQRSGRRN